MDYNSREEKSKMRGYARQAAFISFVILAILINTASSVTPAPVTDFESTFSSGPFIIYVFIALLFIGGVCALALAVGYAFNMQRLIVWAKVELLNAIAVALLISIITGLLLFSFDFVATFMAGGSVYCGGIPIPADESLSMQVVMMCRVQEKITEVDDLYAQIYETNKNWEVEGSKCWSFFGFTVQCGDWKPIVRKQIETAHLLATKITGLEVGLHLEYVAVQYIFLNMLTVFLPLGLVFMAFPLTRGVGGLLVAIALSMYFIFPMLAVFFDPGFVQSVEHVDVFEQDYSQGCYGGFLGSLAITYDIRSDGHVEKTNFSYARAADIYTGILYGAQFYHYIAFALTIVIIAMLAPIFGGDLGEMTRFLLKVV